MTAPPEALALVPDDLSSIDGAPLMCAGLTTFNALRNSGAQPGDVVAVLGIGGLGHLGVQFAAKMGFKTVAIARGKDKEPLARKLGAMHYVDSQTQNPATELNKLGGAKVIIATVTNADAMTAVLGGLGANGMLMVIGAAGPLSVDPILLIGGRRSVKGWYSGTSIDSQDTLKFSAMAGVQSMNEVFPLARVTEAYERMMSGKARFRVVLSMGELGLKGGWIRLRWLRQDCSTIARRRWIRKPEVLVHPQESRFFPKVSSRNLGEPVLPWPSRFRFVVPPR